MNAPRILLVEDDAGLRELFLEELLVDGYTVVECGNCFEMLHYLEGMPYRSHTELDCIVCESETHGISTLSMLNVAAGLMKLPPVILLTLFDDETATRVRALEDSMVWAGSSSLEGLLVLVHRFVKPFKRPGVAVLPHAS